MNLPITRNGGVMQRKQETTMHKGMALATLGLWASMVGCAPTSTTEDMGDEGASDVPESEDVATTESALTYDGGIIAANPPASTGIATIPKLKGSLHLVSCPMIHMDATTWTGLPADYNLPGNPSTDVMYYPSSLPWPARPYTPVTMLYATKQVGVVMNCARGDTRCIEDASIYLWSDVVPPGDCQKVPVTFSVEGTLMIMNDPVEIHLKSGLFQDVAVIRVLASGDAYVRKATGSYAYLGALPVDGRTAFTLSAIYDPKTHELSVHNGAGGVVDLTGVDFGFEASNGAAVTILPQETSTTPAVSGVSTMTFFGVRKVEVAASGILFY